MAKRSKSAINAKKTIKVGTDLSFARWKFYIESVIIAQKLSNLTLMCHSQGAKNFLIWHLGVKCQAKV